MDWASTSTECQSFSNVDSVFYVLEHDWFSLQNLSYNSWDDFVNYDEFGFVANSKR